MFFKEGNSKSFKKVSLHLNTVMSWSENGHWVHSFDIMNILVIGPIWNFVY